MYQNTTDVYSGSIDWNTIYNEFYPLDRIERRLQGYLHKPRKITFCGFGDIANRLSKRHSVHFIEHSESIASCAEFEFPDIDRISHSDILDAIGGEDAPVVFITCRVSAYWTSPDSLYRFLKGIQKSKKELVLIDFFDATNLQSNRTLGNLTFNNIDQIVFDTNETGQHSTPLHLLLATVKGSYYFNTKTVSFSETRAFYDPFEIREFVASQLDEYDISIKPPIVDMDPGFTLVIRQSAKLQDL